MKDNTYGLIYKVTNTINEKIYIGQTTQTLHKRRIRHESGSRKKNTTIHFHRALKRHLLENFHWEILEYCDDRIELDDLEYHYIMQFNSYKKGYNSSLGGESSYGRICTDATRKKMSEARRGIPLSKEAVAKMSERFRGVKKSPEHIKNVAAAKSEYWEITYPNGDKKIIKNLSAFCEKNNLNGANLWAISKGLRPGYKGYKWKKVAKQL